MHSAAAPAALFGASGYQLRLRCTAVSLQGRLRFTQEWSNIRAVAGMVQLVSFQSAGLRYKCKLSLHGNVQAATPHLQGHSSQRGWLRAPASACAAAQPNRVAWQGAGAAPHRPINAAAATAPGVAAQPRRGRMVALQARRKGSQQDRVVSKQQDTSDSWQGMKAALLPQATAQQPVGTASLCTAAGRWSPVLSQPPLNAPPHLQARGGRARANGWEGHRYRMHLRTRAAAVPVHWPPTIRPCCPIHHSQCCPPPTHDAHHPPMNTATAKLTRQRQAKIEVKRV